jgi:Protein of unknown function (DUF2997)
MPKVEVEILPDGTTKVHVVGVAGPSCVPLTRALEQSLGTVTDLTKSAEFYQQPQTNAPQKRTVTH